ncbi:MAG: rhomboid family intramembrane serine protease [Flavobacteriaceae bacterium]|jgi:membrane associated rhomboid family serine protease|tara:strand:+ start:210 stop:1073 length:864 start_codon:yes stop_codon:yes gene_type:complete
MEFWHDIKLRFASLNTLEKIIAINAVFFVLPFILTTVLYLFKISISGWFDYVELSANIGTAIFRPWTILTYGFFHASIGHIFWNMMLLYISGRLMLNLFKEKLLLNTFFVGIIAGGLTYLISYNVFPVFSSVEGSLIGSSAGVMAVLIFMASYMPNSPIRVFVFSIPLKYIALAFIFIDLVQIPTSNAGGHIAHLGGALWGYVYQRQFLQGNDIGAWFINSYEALIRALKTKPKSKRSKRRTKATASNAVDAVDQQKIDAILDKIASSGYESLTKAEKEYLFRAGKQ